MLKRFLMGLFTIVAVVSFSTQTFAAAQTSRHIYVDSMSDNSASLSDASRVYVYKGQVLDADVSSLGKQPVWVHIYSGGKTLFKGYVNLSIDWKNKHVPVGYVNIEMSCSWLDDFCAGEGMLRAHN